MNGEQEVNGKSKSSTDIYTNKNITELNELINAEAKLVCEKIGVPLKSINKKLKTKMENSIGNANKKNYENRKKTIKQRKNAETCWNKMKKQHKKK